MSKTSIYAALLLYTTIVSALLAGSASALQTVTLVEGQSQIVNISQKDLNVIKVPSSSGIKAYTVSRALDVKVEGGNIYVNLMDKSTTAPQELFVVTPMGTYLIMLMPKGIPAEMIIVRTPTETIQDALQWEQSHDHDTGVKELIKSMYQEIPPMGFALNPVNKDATTWHGTQRKVIARYVGAAMEGEVHELVNTSNMPLRVSENEFYDRGVLAVSIERHEIPPQDRTMIYIVSRSSTQRHLDESMRRYNPLDVLKGKAGK